MTFTGEILPFLTGMGEISASKSGTAVYAYCILDHNSSYTTVTHLTFSIDGIQVGTFEHTPDGSNTFKIHV